MAEDMGPVVGMGPVEVEEQESVAWEKVCNYSIRIQLTQ